MPTVIELGVRADGFALCETLAALPDVRFTAERVAAHGPGQWLQLFRVGAPPDIVVDTLVEDPSVDAVTVLADYRTNCVVLVDWVEGSHLPCHVVRETRALLLDATAVATEWTLILFACDRETLQRVRRYCEGEAVVTKVHSTHEFGNGSHDRYGLTPEQRDALLVAYERGYYDLPHRASTAELGETLGISHQAVSARLRRAHRSLVEAVVLGRRRSEMEDDTSRD